MLSQRQLRKAQIGGVEADRYVANPVVGASAQHARMVEVQGLMSLFVSTIMCHELLSSLQAWHPIMQIIRNDDAEAKQVAG